MVRERPGADEYCAEAAQRGEEFLRTSDSGECQKTLARQPLPGDRGECGADHRPPNGRAGLFSTRRLRLGAKHDHCVGAGNPAAKVLAQRTCGHHPAVSKAVFGIDYDQREGLADGRILEPIVEYDGARSSRDRGCAVPGSRRPSRPGRCRRGMSASTRPRVWS